jgi:MerR family transcriptional regulator, light-induced transcriptional regulator
MTAESVYERYLEAISTGDRRAALRVVEETHAGGMDVPTLYLEVFQPALREIGRLWQENRLTVAEEHFATAITEFAMLRLLGDVPPASGPLLIAACADTERHEIGLRMLCDLLELEGWETVFLGAAVPAESLAAMVAERRPRVVALSASISPHLPQLRASIAAVRALSDPPLVVVGGRPFLEQPELADAVGADLTAADAREAASLLNERCR